MKYKKFKDWNIFAKITFGGIVSVVPFLILVFFYIVPSLKNTYYRNKEENVKQTVELAYNLIAEFYDKSAAGEMSKAEAQQSVLNLIKSLRYNKTEYFWINDLEPRMILHPIKPELNGKSLKENKDPNGKYLFIEMVNTATKKGEGFVAYQWPKPGHSDPVDKISFIKLFKEWGWVVGSGIYIDDVNQEIASIRNNILIILFMITLATIGFSYLFGLKISKPIKELENAANSIVNGNYKVQVSVQSEDEIGKLAQSFNLMTEKILMQVQNLDNLPSAVLSIDRGFNIQYVNKKTSAIIGKDQDELIGMKCYDQFNTKDCKTENCALHKAMKNDEVIVRETISRPQNEELPIIYSGSPIKNRNGEIIGGLETITEIKEIKDLQNYLTRSTNKLMLSMQEFEKGDLTVTVEAEKNNDDVGKLIKGFNQAISKIHKMIEQVSEAVQATVSASSQISSSTEEMAAGTQQQSMQVTEVASAVEQMTRTIMENSKNAFFAAEAAKLAGNKAKNGGKSVRETIEGMERISRVVEKSSTSIKALGNSSKEIGEIVQVIDDIADQTNLLALNAAIEAARAGEQGKGFAVVADEVRKLAEKTTGATKKIAQMIKQIQKDTISAVESMLEGTSEVSKGKELADNSGKILEEIITDAEKVNDIINQVAAANEQQSAVAEEISKNIEGMSNVTHESASGIEEIAKSAESLNRLTDSLGSLIKRFRLKSEKNNYLIDADKSMIEAG